MKSFAILAGSAVLLLGASVAPIIPTPMHWEAAYQGQVNQNATSTPAYVPEIGTTTVSVAVFTTHSGQRTEVQIPNAEYAQMRQTGGVAFNPTANENLSVVGAVTPAAHAAVTRDAITQNQAVNVTSITFSHTVSGTNRYLIVATASQPNTNPFVATVTYNGTSLAQISSNLACNERDNLWGLVAPASGANNVVVDRVTGGSGWLSAVADSYTGVDQVTPVDVSAAGGASPSPVTASMTTTVPNVFGVMLGCATSAVTPAASTNSTLVNGFFDYDALFDTNGSGAFVSAGSASMVYTLTSGSGRWVIVGLRPSASALVAPDSTSNFILFN